MAAGRSKARNVKQAQEIIVVFIPLKNIIINRHMKPYLVGAFIFCKFEKNQIKTKSPILPTVIKNKKDIYINVNGTNRTVGACAAAAADPRRRRHVCSPNPSLPRARGGESRSSAPCPPHRTRSRASLSQLRLRPVNPCQAHAKARSTHPTHQPDTTCSADAPALRVPRRRPPSRARQGTWGPAGGTSAAPPPPRALALSAERG
jgi:hypothetical protein